MGGRDRKAVKRAPTQSAVRKKKAQTRSRKQAQKKKAENKPSWVQAIKSKYDEKSSAKKNRKNRDYDEEGLPVDDEDAVQVQDEVDEEKQERMNKATPLDTQLFLKSVPITMKEGTMKQFFGQFGTVKRLLIVKSHVTGRSSGSAFVHFGSGKEADKAFEYAQQNGREVSAANRTDFKNNTAHLSHHQAKKQAYKLKNGAKEDTDPFVIIGESRIFVHRVLSRVDSQEATSAMIKKKKRTKVAGDDPRNLYLLQEGMITRDSPAAEGLPERYLNSLENDYNQRKEQLKNINFFVSKVRLSLRNIPRKETAETLRAMVIKELKAYYRKNPEDKNPDNWGKHGPVRNLKIVLDGNGQSRGFGFCELASHGAALHILRRLNNNPNIYGAHQRLMVAFSVENITAVQKLQQIRDHRKANNKRGREHEDDNEVSNANAEEANAAAAGEDDE